MAITKHGKVEIARVDIEYFRFNDGGCRSDHMQRGSGPFVGSERQAFEHFFFGFNIVRTSRETVIEALQVEGVLEGVCFLGCSDGRHVMRLHFRWPRQRSCPIMRGGIGRGRQNHYERSGYPSSGSFLCKGTGMLKGQPSSGKSDCALDVRSILFDDVFISFHISRFVLTIIIR